MSARRIAQEDITWFLDLDKNGQIDLDPPYQRRSVWTPKDKRFYLDTIFRGYPCPSIYLHKDMEDIGKTIYHVVDGKQRIKTILDFVDNKIRIDKNYGDIRLDNKRWKDIEDNSLKRDFLDYTLVVEYIDAKVDTAYVTDVFDRMNRNSRKLVPQELRHAQFDGRIAKFIEHQSVDDKWADMKIATTARARRMADMQFLSELLMIIVYNKLTGFDQRAIDEFYAEYDDIDDGDDESLKEIMTDNENKFMNVRDNIYSMEKYNNIVTKYSRDFRTFYSLWGMMSLNNIVDTDITDIASRYEEFMLKVHEVGDSDDPELLSEQADRDVFRFYKNNVGASTEYPQRMERHNSMCHYILGIEYEDK